jgi:hypothetical protein
MTPPRLRCGPPRFTESPPLHHLSVPPNHLPSAQCLFCQPHGGGNHDSSKSISVGLKKKGGHRPFDRAGWLYGLEGLDCADESLALLQNPLGLIHYLLRLTRQIPLPPLLMPGA